MRTIALIDFSHALRVNYHVRSPDSTPTAAGEHTLAQLSDWRRSVDHAIICLDSPPYWRKQVLPEYKSSRERDEGYIMLCRWTKERLVADGYSIAAAPTFEADDVIATLALALVARCQKVLIVGSDKDAAQSVVDANSHAVHIMAPKGGGEWEERDSEWVHQKYGVWPRDMALFQAITGDNTDDIPGCKGIGPKGAAKLINEFGTIAKMRVAAVKALDDSKLPGAKPLSAFWKNFLEGSPKLPEWLQLTTMRTDVPLDVEALLVKRAPAPLVADDFGEEHGDAWEPSEEDMAQERKTFTVDPEEIISDPPKPTAEDLFAPRGVCGAIQSASTQGAKTEAPKVTTPAHTSAAFASARGSAPVGQSATAHENLSESSVQSARQPRALDEITSIVVDRPDPPSWALALQPSSAKEALQIAAVLFNSRVCSQFGSEKGVYAVISLGRELGLGMMQALQGFHIVKDRPFPSAPLLQALAEGDPNCEWLVCVESTDERATWRTKHRIAGVLADFTYDRAEATKAGCYTGGNKHNWQTRERQMMRKTCMANAVRIWYPRAVAGLHLSEEMNDE